MARYVEAPEWCGSDTDCSIFLAGGITGCADWQQIVTQRLMPFERLAILNPRRKFLEETNLAAEEQIRWEFQHLVVARCVCFWFPSETLCPIALFEYGKYLGRGEVPLFVGCSPNYSRQFDIEIQTKLENPGMVVNTSLESMIDEIIKYLSFTMKLKYGSK